MIGKGDLDRYYHIYYETSNNKLTRYKAGRKEMNIYFTIMNIFWNFVALERIILILYATLQVDKIYSERIDIIDEGK